jgi:hypothetical protein
MGSQKREGMAVHLERTRASINTLKCLQDIHLTSIDI